MFHGRLLSLWVYQHNKPRRKSKEHEKGVYTFLRCFLFAKQTQSKVEAWTRWSYNASTQFTVLCQQSIDLYISISIITNSIFRLCF